MSKALHELDQKERSHKLWETASETEGSNKNQNTKHACIVEGHESKRESTLPRSRGSHHGERVRIFGLHST